MERRSSSGRSSRLRVRPRLRMRGDQGSRNYLAMLLLWTGLVPPEHGEDRSRVNIGQTSGRNGRRPRLDDADLLHGRTHCDRLLLLALPELFE